MADPLELVIDDGVAEIGRATDEGPAQLHRNPIIPIPVDDEQGNPEWQSLVG